MSDKGLFKYKGRREDGRFITGQGQYTNDHNLPGQAYACFRRSDRAHAIIKSIDVEAAKRSPGVLAVLTAKDVAGEGFGTLPPIQPPPGLRFAASTSIDLMMAW